jgi:hypothetical protein
MADVPLHEVLPRDYLACVDELRGLADKLSGYRSAAGRVAWHWYPRRADPLSISDATGSYLLIVDTTISLYDHGHDWLELALDIAWRPPPMLTVNAAVEVGCWCREDHNMHQVRTVHRQVANRRELVEAFAAGTAMLAEVLDAGPFEPHPWRMQAGLPDPPTPSR